MRTSGSCTCMPPLQPRSQTAILRPMPVSRVARWHVDSGELGEACPRWARWNGALDHRYTLGVEEELMLLDPASGSLAASCDGTLEQLSHELSLHASPETHASVIELRTGVHTDVEGV